MALTLSQPVADDIPRFLTVEQFCDRFQIRKTKAYELMNSAQVRSVKIGGARRIPVDAVKEFAASLTGGEFAV